MIVCTGSIGDLYKQFGWGVLIEVVVVVVVGFVDDLIPSTACHRWDNTLLLEY